MINRYSFHYCLKTVDIHITLFLISSMNDIIILIMLFLLFYLDSLNVTFIEFITVKLIVIYILIYIYIYIRIYYPSEGAYLNHNIKYIYLMKRANNNRSMNQQHSIDMRNLFEELATYITTP